LYGLFSIHVGSPEKTGFEVVCCFPFSDIVEEDGCGGDGDGNNNEVTVLPKLKNGMVTVRIREIQ
jgi:hypothetical protein